MNVDNVELGNIQKYYPAKEQKPSAVSEFRWKKAERIFNFSLFLSAETKLSLSLLIHDHQKVNIIGVMIVIKALFPSEGKGQDDDDDDEGLLYYKENKLLTKLFSYLLIFHATPFVLEISYCRAFSGTGAQVTAMISCFTYGTRHIAIIPICTVFPVAYWLR